MGVRIGVAMLVLVFAACSGDDHGSPSSGALGGSAGAPEDHPGESAAGRGPARPSPSNSAGSTDAEPSDVLSDGEPEREASDGSAGSSGSGGSGSGRSVDELGGAPPECVEACGGEEPSSGGERSTPEGGYTAHSGGMTGAGIGGAASAGRSSVGGRSSSVGGGGGAHSAGASASAGSPGLPVGDPAEGELIELDYDCRSCHGDDLSGAGRYPNLTPHPTNGIGAWSDAQIARAIRAGKNELDETLCSLMPRYPFSDQKVAHLIAYLRSFPASAKNITQVCPGHGR